MSSEKTTKQNKKQPAPKIGLGFYTLGEEIANSITHGLGAPPLRTIRGKS